MFSSNENKMAAAQSGLAGDTSISPTINFGGGSNTGLLLFAAAASFIAFRQLRG